MTSLKKKKSSTGMTTTTAETSSTDATGAAVPTESEKTIEVRFTTKLSEEYRVTDTAFSVPARLTRRGLSEVVNHLLGHGESEGVPFDFLAAGEFVRASLEKHLRDRGVAVGEGTVEVEYTLAMPAPDELPSHQHGDWVSAVCPVCLPGGIDGLASGGYDRRIRIWGADASSALAAAAEAHGTVVKSLVAFGEGKSMLLSTGKDAIARVWRLSSSESGAVGLVSVASLSGHTDAVDAADASPNSTRACTASWDKTIRIWDVATLTAEKKEEGADAPAEEDGEAPAKKRKEEVAEAEEMEVEGGNGPKVVAVLEGHTDAVTAVQWPTHVQLVSGGHDGTIRLWDAIKAENVSTMRGPQQKSVSCITYSTANGICASGHHDGVVRLWDPRASEGSTIVAKTVRAHRGWVCSAAWHPSKPTVLLSGSFDGALKVWDLRSTTPMHTARGAHGGKVLCATWWQKSDGKVEIVSGGADGKVSRRAVP